MARKLKSDRVLFLTTLLLVCLSIVMVYSASAVKTPYTFLMKQLMWAALGFALLTVVMRIDYRHYREPAFIWAALGVVTASLIAVLFMPPVNKAARWFGIGGLGGQPSEPAKLVAIVFIAAVLERRMHRINDVWYALAPIAAVVLGWVGLIVIEPDFGTSIALLLIASVMVFSAGLSYRYLFSAVALGLPAVVLLIVTSDYRMGRVLTFLNPWEDRLGRGYQIIQSLIAVGSGGIRGHGLMNGVQQLHYLPEAQTDFIYAVIAEELGLVGATLVLLGFCVIIWRGIRITLGASDQFGAFLALGVTTMVAVQAFINMSVVLHLMPTKGIALPFVSFGGSSLVVNLVAMGVLLNVSKDAAAET